MTVARCYAEAWHKGANLSDSTNVRGQKLSMNDFQLSLSGGKSLVGIRVHILAI